MFARVKNEAVLERREGKERGARRSVQGGKQIRNERIYTKRNCPGSPRGTIRRVEQHPGEVRPA